MTGRITNWTKALTAAAVAALALGARAAPGDGIRLGGAEARLHPFIDLETRYDSNVNYTPSNQAIADLILHVRPGLELLAPSDVAAVEFSGALDWAQYMGIDGDTTGLSNLYGNAGFAALFNRRGTVSPRIDNTFDRAPSTTSLAAASVAVVSNKNTLALSLPYKPGGGALVFAATAKWNVETFDEYTSLTSAQKKSLADFAYDEYRVGGEVQWRFLPRTTGLFQADYLSRMPRASNRPDEATGFDVIAGVTGLMTQRIAATAKVGYGSTNATNVSAADASAFLTDLSVEWLPVDQFSVRAGYARSLGLDPTLSTYVSDAVSAGLRWKLADRIAFKMGARWDRFAFQAVDGANSSYFRVDPEVEGLFGRWLKTSLGYVYSMRTASWPAGLGGSPPDYSKSEVFLRVGLTY
jgi:hypothetical protein